MRNLIRLVYVVTLFAATFALAQQPPSNSQNGESPKAAVRKVAATEPSKTVPKVTEEQRLALQLLETSEAASRGFEPPMRAFSLMNVAQALTGIDQARARDLLRDAFTASLEIHDDDDTKARLQQEILRSLLPLSQADVEELLPQAEMSVRKPITDIIVGRYAEKKQFDKAFELVNQITALDEFPYGSAAKLIEALPQEMVAEKQGLFAQALSSYKTHQRKAGRITVGGDTFADLVVKYGLAMPPKMVLAAIDEILGQDKNLAEEQLSITVGGDGGTASFASRYEYDLFAVLPVLRQLDESRAKQLLEDNQTLQSKVQQYPQGLGSLDPAPSPTAAKDANSNRRGLNTMVSMGGSHPGGGGQSAAAAQSYMNQEAQRRVQQIVEEGATDPTQAIAHSMTLPLSLDGMGRSSPRASALLSIANANVKKNPGAASQALSEMRKMVGDIKPDLQAQYLATAADTYLKLGDKENADKAVNEGFKIADKMLENDANPDNPNQALKAWWPSADAYRRFVEVEAKISQPATLNVLKEIKDPEIRATESIMVARSLVGLAVKRFMVAERRKDSNRMWMTDTN